MREFYNKVPGVSHKNPGGSDRQEIIKKYCKLGQELILIPEPDNEYEANAVGLWVEVKGFLSTKRFQIGYLESLTAMREYPRIQKGKVRVFIKEITGGTVDKATRGVNILVQLLD